jgi:cell division protein FtsL
MGMPACRIEADPFARRFAQLRLVTTPAAPAPAPVRTRTRTSTRTSGGASTRARARQEEARARAAFGVFVLVLTCAIALGGARVTLIVRAAEASITESRVQADIKAQRAEADKLEVDRSALSTPSRIAGIASASMNMGEPRSVRYISLDAHASAAAAAPPGTGAGHADGAVASSDVLGRLLGAVMDLSAGEAQSLLVGDLGLAGSR